MDIRSLQEQLGAWLDAGAAYVVGIPPEILLVVLVLPLLLAVVSARLPVIVGTALFLIASVIVLTRPALAAPAIVSLMWVTGAVVAVTAISGRRTRRALEAQLESLQGEIVELQARESQRYLTELRYGHSATDANNHLANAASPAPELNR